MPAAARRFHKPQTSFEVLNDVNSNLTNLYRCVREQPEERRTAAGEMLLLHFVQAATNVLQVNFMPNFRRMCRPLRRSRIGRQIASGGSPQPDTSFLLTEAKEAETTQETAVYTESTAVQETTVQITSPTVVTTISTTTTTPETTTQTTNAPPQIVDMNALSPQMWVFLTEAGNARR